MVRSSKSPSVLDTDRESGMYCWLGMAVRSSRNDQANTTWQIVQICFGAVSFTCKSRTGSIASQNSLLTDFDHSDGRWWWAWVSQLGCSNISINENLSPSKPLGSNGLRKITHYVNNRAPSQLSTCTLHPHFWSKRLFSCSTSAYSILVDLRAGLFGGVLLSVVCSIRPVSLPIASYQCLSQARQATTLPGSYAHAILHCNHDILPSLKASLVSSATSICLSYPSGQFSSSICLCSAKWVSAPSS